MEKTQNILKKFIILLAALFITSTNISAQEAITLKSTNNKPVFSDTVLDLQDDDTDPVETIDDNTIYIEENQPTPLIQAPKYPSAKGGISDYDSSIEASASKFLLFDILYKTVQDVYNL